MSTKSEILKIGDQLIRAKGINAFSFADISKILGIKNASIHYYFPTKADLVNSILDEHHSRLQAMIGHTSTVAPEQKLHIFLSIYDPLNEEGNICIVGALASAMNTVSDPTAAHLKDFAATTINWVTDILEEGTATGAFKFAAPPRTKALMIITNMIASLQLARVTGKQDFETIKDTIIKELKA